MKKPIGLVCIPDEKYSDYRNEVIFNAYKWDPQVGDHNTLSKYAVLLQPEIALQLEEMAETLAEETILMEEKFLGKINLAKDLKLGRTMNRELYRLCGYKRGNNVRLMRFDFHPTESGWALSEVNSDVPGGLAESSLLPVIAERYFKEGLCGTRFDSVFIKALKMKLKEGGRIALVHATSYSDDRQVMQFLSDSLTQSGFQTIFAAPDHITWENRKAVSILEGNEGYLDGIIRFFPLEWLMNLSRKSGWQGYFESETLSCNHPAAIFTQSKRLPLVWDKLDTDISMWKNLLPETKSPKEVKFDDEKWIFKPALGRVGEGISIKEAITDSEMKNIKKAVRIVPSEWIAQRKFKSKALEINGESYHLCIGVFTVDSKFAGFYGRISPYPRIDANARDIPVLIAKGGENDE